MVRIKRGRPRKKSKEKVLSLAQAVRRGRKRVRNTAQHQTIPRAIHDLLEHDIDIQPNEYCIWAANGRIHTPHGLPINGHLVEVPLRVFSSLPVHADLPKYILNNTDIKRYQTRIDISTTMPILVPRTGTKYVLINPESVKQRWPCIPNTRLQVFVVDPGLALRPDQIDVLRYAAVDSVCLDPERAQHAQMVLSTLQKQYSDSELFRRLYALTGKPKKNSALGTVATSYVRLFECRSRSVRSRTRQRQNEAR